MLRHDGAMPPLDHDHCYGIVRSGDRRFDGVFVTAGEDHGDLLQAELPRNDPEADQRRVPPHTCSSPATGLSGMQAMPPRRFAWVAGMESATGRRRPSNADDC